MTGYGKSVLQLPTKKITIEVKSLNSKSLDLSTRMPSVYKEKELALRKLIANQLLRGKIDFSIQIEITGEDTYTKINTLVVKDYISQLKTVVANGNDMEYLQIAIRLPEAITNEKGTIDPTEWSLIENAINETLNKIISYRQDEGAALKKDFENRITIITELLNKITDIDPERIENVKIKLEKGVAELKEKLDENRFEQELIYYLEKLDITEEKVRLNNHLAYFIKTLNAPEANGKKLGFIGQEMGREINTIGSKANYAPMQKLVVQMKDELEKIKEQLLNVL